MPERAKETEILVEGEGSALLPPKGKRQYQTPQLVAFGAVKDLTRQGPPIIDCSGDACAD